MPAEAKGTDETAAKAFVKHYLAVFSYAARTGDVDELKSLGGESCESCAGVVTRITNTYSKGGHADGRGYKPRTMKVSLGATAGAPAVVTLQIISFKQVIYASPSAKPQQIPADQINARFELSRNTTGWIVRDWTRL